MQVVRSLPSSPPVHDDPPPHFSSHTLIQAVKAATGDVGHSPTQALREPPGQPVGEGVGVGGVGGVGVGGVGGVGVGGVGVGPEGHQCWPQLFSQWS